MISSNTPNIDYNVESDGLVTVVSIEPNITKSQWLQFFEQHLGFKPLTNTIKTLQPENAVAFAYLCGVRNPIQNRSLKGMDQFNHLFKTVLFAAGKGSLFCEEGLWNLIPPRGGALWNPTNQSIMWPKSSNKPSKIWQSQNLRIMFEAMVHMFLLRMPKEIPDDSGWMMLCVTSYILLKGWIILYGNTAIVSDWLCHSKLKMVAMGVYLTVASIQGYFDFQSQAEDETANELWAEMVERFPIPDLDVSYTSTDTTKWRNAANQIWSLGNQMLVDRMNARMIDRSNRGDSISGKKRRRMMTNENESVDLSSTTVVSSLGSLAAKFSDVKITGAEKIWSFEHSDYATTMMGTGENANLTAGTVAELYQFCLQLTHDGRTALEADEITAILVFQEAIKFLVVRYNTHPIMVAGLLNFTVRTMCRIMNDSEIHTKRLDSKNEVSLDCIINVFRNNVIPQYLRTRTTHYVNNLSYLSNSLRKNLMDTDFWPRAREMTIHELHCCNGYNRYTEHISPFIKMSLTSLLQRSPFLNDHLWVIFVTPTNLIKEYMGVPLSDIIVSDPMRLATLTEDILDVIAEMIEHWAANKVMVRSRQNMSNQDARQEQRNWNLVYSEVFTWRNSQHGAPNSKKLKLDQEHLMRNDWDMMNQQARELKKVAMTGTPMTDTPMTDTPMTDTPMTDTTMSNEQQTKPSMDPPSFAVPKPPKRPNKLSIPSLRRQPTMSMIPEPAEPAKQHSAQDILDLERLHNAPMTWRTIKYQGMAKVGPTYQRRSEGMPYNDIQGIEDVWPFVQEWEPEMMDTFARRMQRQHVWIAEEKKSIMIPYALCDQFTDTELQWLHNEVDLKLFQTLQYDDEVEQKGLSGKWNSVIGVLVAFLTGVEQTGDYGWTKKIKTHGIGHNMYGQINTLYDLRMFGSAIQFITDKAKERSKKKKEKKKTTKSVSPEGRTRVNKNEPDHKQICGSTACGEDQWGIVYGYVLLREIGEACMKKYGIEAMGCEWCPDLNDSSAWQQVYYFACHRCFDLKAHFICNPCTVYQTRKKKQIIWANAGKSSQVTHWCGKSTKDPTRKTKLKQLNKARKDGTPITFNLADRPAMYPYIMHSAAQILKWKIRKEVDEVTEMDFYEACSLKPDQIRYPKDVQPGPLGQEEKDWWMRGFSLPRKTKSMTVMSNGLHYRLYQTAPAAADNDWMNFFTNIARICSKDEKHFRSMYHIYEEPVVPQKCLDKGRRLKHEWEPKSNTGFTEEDVQDFRRMSNFIYLEEKISTLRAIVLDAGTPAKANTIMGLRADGKTNRWGPRGCVELSQIPKANRRTNSIVNPTIETPNENACEQKSERERPIPNHLREILMLRPKPFDKNRVVLQEDVKEALDTVNWEKYKEFMDILGSQRAVMCCPEYVLCGYQFDHYSRQQRQFENWKRRYQSIGQSDIPPATYPRPKEVQSKPATNWGVSMTDLTINGKAGVHIGDNEEYIRWNPLGEYHYEVEVPDLNKAKSTKNRKGKHHQSHKLLLRAVMLIEKTKDPNPRVMFINATSSTLKSQEPAIYHIVNLIALYEATNAQQQINHTAGTQWIMEKANNLPTGALTVDVNPKATTKGTILWESSFWYRHGTKVDLVFGCRDKMEQHLSWLATHDDMTNTYEVQIRDKPYWGWCMRMNFFYSSCCVDTFDLLEIVNILEDAADHKVDNQRNRALPALKTKLRSWAKNKNHAIGWAERLCFPAFWFEKGREVFLVRNPPEATNLSRWAMEEDIERERRVTEARKRILLTAQFLRDERRQRTWMTFDNQGADGPAMFGEKAVWQGLEDTDYTDHFLIKLLKLRSIPNKKRHDPISSLMKRLIKLDQDMYQIWENENEHLKKSKRKPEPDKRRLMDLEDVVLAMFDICPLPAVGCFVLWLYDYCKQPQTLAGMLGTLQHDAFENHIIWGIMPKIFTLKTEEMVDLEKVMFVRALAHYTVLSFRYLLKYQLDSKWSDIKDHFKCAKYKLFDRSTGPPTPQSENEASDAEDDEDDNDDKRTTPDVIMRNDEDGRQDEVKDRWSDVDFEAAEKDIHNTVSPQRECQTGSSIANRVKTSRRRQGKRRSIRGKNSKMSLSNQSRNTVKMKTDTMVKKEKNPLPPSTKKVAIKIKGKNKKSVRFTTNNLVDLTSDNDSPITQTPKSFSKPRKSNNTDDRNTGAPTPASLSLAKGVQRESKEPSSLTSGNRNRMQTATGSMQEVQEIADSNFSQDHFVRSLRGTRAPYVEAMKSFAHWLRKWEAEKGNVTDDVFQNTHRMLCNLKQKYKTLLRQHYKKNPYLAEKILMVRMEYDRRKAASRQAAAQQPSTADVSKQKKSSKSDKEEEE